MPLPATISNGIWPDHRNANIGPRESGGNLYAPFYVFSGTMQLGMFKSTDGGETWTEQDSANRPTGVISTALAVGQITTTLYVLYTPSAVTAQIRKFDCSTDTWVALESGMATSPPTLNANITGAGAQPGFLIVRGDGDYVVFHNGSTENVMGSAYRRIKYSRFQSGAWTINVRVDNGTGDQFHWDARAAVLGSSSRSHFFYTKSSSSLGFHKALTSANALQAEGNDDGTLLATPTAAYCFGNPVAYVDGADTKIVVPTDNKAWRFTSADLPTLTTVQVYAGVSQENVTSNPSAAVVDGTTAYTFYTDASTDDLWYDNDAGSGTWGTDVKFPVSVSQEASNNQPSLYGATGTDEMYAQSFQVSSALDLTGMSLRLSKFNTPTDTLVVDIQSSLGTTITSSDAVAAATVPTTPDWVAFVFASPPALSAGVTYYAVLRRTGARDTTNIYEWRAQTANPYANGQAYERASGVWGDLDGVTSLDFTFRIRDYNYTIQGVSVGKITNAIGILYNDNGTVKYDKLQLTVPTKAPPAHLQLRYQRQAQRTTWRTAV